ncbi:MAG: hypothetical protein ACTSVT_05340 [Candidatus Thorarchaeota archaeon]
MSVILLLIISLVIHTIPIPPTSELFRFPTIFRWLPTRLLWGFGAWAFICLMMQMTLPWAIITVAMSYSVLLVFSTLIQFKRGMAGAETLPKVMVCTGIILMILIPAYAMFVNWTSDVSNAEYVDNFITQADGPLFENPIPDNQVRLVTSELATFQARRIMNSIGSNVEIAAAHITVRNGRLVWVCVIVSTNTLAENYLQGLIVVDANDPNQVEVITDVGQMPVGEGLFWDKNIQFGNYLEDMSNAYEYAYPTWDPIGNLVYIQTRTNLGPDFVEYPLGPRVYCANGTVRTYATLEETPDWITQAYSEEWLERQIARWGGYRRGDGFDLFAGGFLWIVQASRDRLAITEDTRYIINPDTGRVEALVAVHPMEATSLTLSGFMRATKDAIYYHDMHNYSLMSGEAAVNAIIKDLPPPTSGQYYGAMPLLYPVQINSTYSRFAWYCPIYWYQSEYDSEADEYSLTDIRLYALGIVDGQHETIKAYSTSSSGEELVRTVREAYVQSVVNALTIEPESEENVELSATVLNVTSYVDGGDTHIVLRTDNSTYEWIEGSKDWMPLTDWYELLTVAPGDSFTATIEKVGSQYRIVAFSKT